MSRFKNPFFLLMLLTSVPLPLAAQNFSYDGNRWYEIEVSIFSNENIAENSELVISEKVQLSYQEPIRKLIPASSLYSVEFDQEEVEAPFELTDVSESRQQLTIFGPAENQRDSSFRITDFNRDPFIALGNESASFLEYNLDISESPEYRLLFHAVWRQPVLNRVQATAIFVEGGNLFGDHHELEGSLRFSYNVNRVDVEARLWLSQFSSTPAGASMSWQLPSPPFSNSTQQENDGNIELMYYVEELAYMDQVRAMISNELHFLDHPELGILVEIRPYQLPELNNFFD